MYESTSGTACVRTNSFARTSSLSTLLSNMSPQAVTNISVGLTANTTFANGSQST
jgi:hypothetical protein